MIEVSLGGRNTVQEAGSSVQEAGSEPDILKRENRIVTAKRNLKRHGD